MMGMNDWFDILKELGEPRMSRTERSEEIERLMDNLTPSIEERYTAMAKNEECCRNAKLQAIKYMEGERKSFWGSKYEWPKRKTPLKHPLMDVPCSEFLFALVNSRHVEEHLITKWIVEEIGQGEIPIEEKNDDGIYDISLPALRKRLAFLTTRGRTMKNVRTGAKRTKWNYNEMFNPIESWEKTMALLPEWENCHERGSG